MTIPMSKYNFKGIWKIRCDGENTTQTNLLYFHCGPRGGERTPEIENKRQNVFLKNYRAENHKKDNAFKNNVRGNKFFI